MENIQIGNIKWYCASCDLFFRVRADLYKHRKAVHKSSKGKNIKVEKNCPYCQRVLMTETAYKVHIKSCSNNPSRISRPNKFIWTSEMKDKQSTSMKQAHAEGRAFSWADLSKRKEPSYPEKWFIRVLENEFGFIEGKDYEREKKFYTFSLDFVFPNKKVIEIDGSQHKRSDYQRDCDKRKDQKLKEEGWLELRLDWNYCYNNSKEVIQKVKEFLG